MMTSPVCELYASISWPSISRGMTSWAQLSYRLVVGCLLLLSLGSGSGLLAAAGCWLLLRRDAAAAC
jgi:hypothetical protein